MVFPFAVSSALGRETGVNAKLTAVRPYSASVRAWRPSLESRQAEAVSC